jgi:hypothetical protein
MADEGAQKPSAWKLLGPALRRHLPNLLRLAVGAVSSGTLPPGAARALDGLLGGVAGSAVSSRALRQLEAQVGSSQMELDSQLRLHREALAELHTELSDIRAKLENQARRGDAQSAQFAAQLAELRRLTVRLVIGTGVALLLLLAAVFIMLRR